MNVLVTHECSDVVASAFRALGHNAWSNDLKPSSTGSRYHLQMDYREALAAERWDLLIGHPVCTYLCNSGVSRLMKTPPNPTPGVLYGEDRWRAMRIAAMHFATLLYKTGIKRVCLENPVMHGHARRKIADILFATQPIPIDGTYAAEQYARPTQLVQPYQFGDDASKLTGLWLRGLEPLVIPPREQWAPPRLVCPVCRIVRVRDGQPVPGSEVSCRHSTDAMLQRWGNQTDSGQNKLTPSAERGAERSVTYAGIARAMALRWGQA